MGSMRVVCTASQVGVLSEIGPTLNSRLSAPNVISHLLEISNESQYNVEQSWR